MEQGRFRIGLRVADVVRGAEFYRGFGFSEVGTVPAADGSPLMTILARRGDVIRRHDASRGARRQRPPA
jgi:hypothetical protein